MPKKVITARDLRKMKKEAVNKPVKHRASPEQRKRIEKHLWKVEHLVMRAKGRPSETSHFTKLKALRDHFCGLPLRDAGLKYGITVDSLRSFKEKFLRVDPGLPQLLEEIMFDASLDAMQIFSEKKEELTPMQAIMAAGITTDKYIKLRQARATDFKPEESLPLKQLHIIEKILEAGQKGKALHAKTIEADVVEIAKLQNKNETENT